MHSNSDAVVFSFSSALVDTTGIKHLVAGHHPVCDAPGADRFQVESVFCPPVKQITQLLRLERRIGRKVVIITAARDHYRPHVQAWLDLHGLEVDCIRFRQVNDHRPDALTKRELMSEVQEEFDVVHAYEGRADVVRAYERLGVPVTCTGTPPIRADSASAA